MYQILYDNNIIYDPRLDERIIREPAVHLGVNEAGSLSFIIDYDHPEINNLLKLSGTVELLQDGSPIYRGRIIRDNKDFNNSKIIETEGLLASLNDSIIPPFAFPDDWVEDTDYQSAAETGNVVAFFLSWLLTQHNAQVNTDRQIHLGTVTVTDPNNYIARASTDYLHTWDVIKDKLLDGSIGGYLLPRYETDGVYLDYLADFPLTNNQPVEFGENLLDLSSITDATGVYTAVLPIGADGLTIEDLPDGAINTDLVKDGKIVYSISGRTTYGKITKPIPWDDVTLPQNLLSKAVASLTGIGLFLEQSISITACDLHCDDETIQSFRVGRYVTVSSSPHGLQTNLAVLTLDPDILDPGNTVITVGATIKTLSDINQSNTAQLSEKINQQAIETNKKLTEVAESTSQQITEAVQTSREIIFSALEEYVKSGDFETYQQTVSASLQILSNSISLNIQQVLTQISQVGNDLQTQITDITKYFRFTSDGLFIGEAGNEVLLRLDNDIIQFLRNNVPGLWMDDNGLNANSIIVGRIQIGNAEITTDDEGRFTLRKAVND